MRWLRRFWRTPLYERRRRLRPGRVVQWPAPTPEEIVFQVLAVILFLVFVSTITGLLPFAIYEFFFAPTPIPRVLDY